MWNINYTLNAKTAKSTNQSGAIFSGHHSTMQVNNSGTMPISLWEGVTKHKHDKLLGEYLAHNNRANVGLNIKQMSDWPIGEHLLFKTRVTTWRGPSVGRVLLPRSGSYGLKEVQKLIGDLNMNTMVRNCNALQSYWHKDDGIRLYPYLKSAV